MEHYNNPANPAKAKKIQAVLAKRNITLVTEVNYWGNKVVNIICPDFGMGFYIVNTVSFTSVWSDVDMITDADVIRHLENKFGIDLSDDALNAEITQTTESVIIEVSEILASGYAELDNIADAYGLDHVCFEYKYSGLLYSVAIIDLHLTYVVSENTRKGQKELLRYETAISDCEHDQLNILVCEYA